MSLDLQCRTDREKGTGENDDLSKKNYQPGREIVKLSIPWWDSHLKKPDLQKVLDDCLEEQGMFSSLVSSWLDCNRNLMKTIRISIYQQNGSADIVKDCLKSVEAYGSSYSKFMDGQFSRLVKFWSFQG